MSPPIFPWRKLSGEGFHSHSPDTDFGRMISVDLWEQQRRIYITDGWHSDSFLLIAVFMERKATVHRGISERNAVRYMKFFTDLKCGLMPYLYAQANKVHTEGIPMMRSMMMEFPASLPVAILTVSICLEIIFLWHLFSARIAL